MAPSTRWLTRLAIVYLTDWIIILSTIIFSGSLYIWAVPSTRPFYLDDKSISFPFQTHTKVSTALLVTLSCLLPGVVCVLLCLFVSTPSTPSTAGWRRRVYAANKAVLGLLMSIALAMLITDSLKNLMGKPRPDMLSRCDPDLALLEAEGIGRGLVTWNICRNLEKGVGIGFDDLRDGFRSFPSGHASMGFAGLTYTSLFLASFVFSMTPPFARTLRPFSKMAEVSPAPQPKFPQMLAFLIVALPVFVATYVASTRWSDYRHHGFDVLFGSAEGMVCACVGWGWYGVFSCRRGGVFKGRDMAMEERSEETEVGVSEEMDDKEERVEGV